MFDIKKKIYERVKYAFDGDHEDDEEWINSVFVLQIKDTTPYKQSNRYGQKTKESCEFCGRKHDINNDICDVKSNQVKDGNDFENGAKILTLADLYA